MSEPKYEVCIGAESKKRHYRLAYDKINAVKAMNELSHDQVNDLIVWAGVFNRDTGELDHRIFIYEGS